MKGKDKVITIVAIGIISATAVVFGYVNINMKNNININISANSKVDLTAKWTITEGKYFPISVSAGDTLYGKNGTVQIKIEEIKVMVIKGEDREKQKPPYTIIKDAKGIVLKGGDKVEVGMELHLAKNPKELITIPEASVPSIKVVRKLW